MPVYEQLIGKLANRLSVNEFATCAAAVGSVSFGVWLEQRVSEESLRELVQSASEGEDLVGLIGAQDGITASSDVLRDSRSLDCRLVRLAIAV